MSEPRIGDGDVRPESGYLDYPPPSPPSWPTAPAEDAGIQPELAGPAADVTSPFTSPAGTPQPAHPDALAAATSVTTPPPYPQPAVPVAGYPAPVMAGPPGANYAPVDLGLLTALPIEDRSYPAFFRTPRWRWWRPLVCLLATSFLAMIAMGVPALIGLVVDGIDFTEMARTGQLKMGPWGFIGNNIGIALCVPIAMLMQWAFFGQRPRWLSSVLGGIRWRWFGTCMAVVIPLWLILNGVEYALTGLPPDITLRPYTWLMIAGIVLTTPFQCAGEEYLMRGLEQRMVASYFKAETVGFVVATIVSSLTFMALHGAGDTWLNIFYFCFGAVSCWLAWRTGGLEASVAVHVVNNVVSEALLPFTDFSDMFNREQGAADPSVLIIVGVLVLTAALLTWLARRTGQVVRTSPGRAEVDAAYAQARSAWAGYAGGVQHP